MLLNKMELHPKLKFYTALSVFTIVLLVIAFFSLLIFQQYTGFTIIPGEAGKITTVNVYDVRPATNWHGLIGVAVMVQQYSMQQKLTVEGTGIDSLNLLFPCLEYGEEHELYASPALDIDWASVTSATPEFIDSYFGITGTWMTAVNTFTENMTVELGNRNITNVPATHTYVHSKPQSQHFDLGILKDGFGNPIFVTHIDEFTEGYNGEIINYQMLLAMPNNGSVTYYFFTDPYDTCPEGWGERQPYGNITGNVTDKATGLPLQYVRIIVGGGMAITNINGSYIMSTEAGNYFLIALKPGYKNYVTNVSVFPGQTTVKNIQLEKSEENPVTPQYERKAGGGGRATTAGVGPGIGPYLEKPKRMEGIDHFITRKEIDRIMRLGTFFEDDVYVFNYANRTAQLDILVRGNVTDKIELDKKRLFVKPNSHEKLKLTVFGKGKPGSYNGSITFKGTFDEKIPIKLLVRAKERLPIEALLLDVTPIRSKVYQGKQLKLKVDLKNLLTERQYNVSLLYKLKDPKINQTITLGSDRRMLNTSLSLIKSFKLPKDIPIGDKVIQVEAEYLNVTTTSNTVVSVTVPFYIIKLFGRIPVWWLFVLLVLIIVAIGLFFYIRKLIKEKKRYHLKVAYKTLPQKGPPRNVFVGKIAETNKWFYFDLNKLTTHAIVAGSTGGGKTISAQVIVEECLKAGIAVVVFDPTAQWSGFLRKCDSEAMFKYYPSFGLKKSDARAFNGNVRQIQDAREKINLKKLFKPGEIHILTTDKLDPKDIDIFVTNTVREVFHEHFDEAPELRYLLVYDEVHRLLPRFGGSGEGFIQIERACREFRKWGIGVLLISQVLTDFASQIKANINTEIQMRTRDEGDLNRIVTKYGKGVLRSLVKATIGTGMVENPAWNYGNPFFVTFRPILHSVHRLSDKELAMYNKYNQLIDDLEYQLEQLKDAGEDVFDVELELRLALDKVKSGNFNMVDIYLDSIKPEIEKRWQKLGKKPKHRTIELVDLGELKTAIEQAKRERKKYLETLQKEEKPEQEEEEHQTDIFAELHNAKPLNFDNGLTVMTLNELIDGLEAMDDETYARHVNENRDDIADWIKDVVKDDELAEKCSKKGRKEILEELRLFKLKQAKMPSEKQSKQVRTPIEHAPKKPEITQQNKEEAEPEKKEKNAVQSQQKPQPTRVEPFYLEEGTQLRSLEELIGALKFMPEDKFRLYVNENKNDFANWVEFCLNKPELADKMRKLYSRHAMIELLEVAT